MTDTPLKTKRIKKNHTDITLPSDPGIVSALALPLQHNKSNVTTEPGHTIFLPIATVLPRQRLGPAILNPGPRSHSRVAPRELYLDNASLGTGTLSILRRRVPRGRLCRVGTLRWRFLRKTLRGLHFSYCVRKTMSIALAGTVAPSPAGGGENAAAVYEETHVHGVYEAIAPHFSATRHKPWPFVASFLASQPPGSVGLDVGCGNGKNMGVNRDVVMLGCDRSAALVALARDLWCSERYDRARRKGKDDDAPAPVADGLIAGADVAVADGLELPFRDESADFVLCIAVIHHLSTRQRRVDAVRQLLRCIRRKGTGDARQGGGQVLVYVWALEQSSSRRGWDEGGEQDLLVPWVMKAPQQKKQQQQPKASQAKQRKQKQGKTDKMRKAEAAPAPEGSHEEDATILGGGEGGEDMQGRQQESHGKVNEAATASTSAASAGGGDLGTAAVTADTADAAAAAAAEPPGKEIQDKADNAGGGSDGQPHTDKTFHRFYHLYREGELEEDVVAAGGEVLSSGYERDNWWVIAG